MVENDNSNEIILDARMFNWNSSNHFDNVRYSIWQFLQSLENRNMQGLLQDFAGTGAQLYFWEEVGEYISRRVPDTNCSTSKDANTAARRSVYRQRLVTAVANNGGGQ